MQTTSAKQFDQYELAGILTGMCQLSQSQVDFYGLDYVAWMRNYCDTLRAYLREDDREGFMESLQYWLAVSPDYAMEFLEVLYGRCGLDVDADWTQFEAIVSF